jgi:glycosyl transferase family 2
MTLLVRDEADVIAANIEYHLSRGVDHVIVTDNGSVDGTRGVVQDLVRGGHVTLMFEPGDDYRQDVWVTRMARAAWEMGADWVINNDADEVWWPVGSDLKAALHGIPPHVGSVVVPRSNMLPLRRLAGHPFSEMVVRDVRSTNAIGRELPGKAAHRAAPDVVVAPGNHSVMSASLGESAASDMLTIFHFPYRTYLQFERKIANGGRAVAKNTEWPQMFDAWRKLYEMLAAGTLRDWYDGLPHADDPADETGRARRDVVRDTRLSAYLRDVLASAP